MALCIHYSRLDTRVCVLIVVWHFAKINFYIRYSKISNWMPISCSCCVAIITKFETQFVYNIYLLEEYFSYTQIDWDANPFEWWNMYKSKFPILSNLAWKYLCISATSTSSERLFSDAGNMMTVKRTSLNQNLFERMAVLKKKMYIIWVIFGLINKN